MLKAICLPTLLNGRSEFSLVHLEICFDWCSGRIKSSDIMDAKDREGEREREHARLIGRPSLMVQS